MRQWIRDIGLALLIVLAITTFIKPTIVHGTSMNPTLQDGDYLLVSKQTYTFEEPERGEIIIFPVGEDNKLYIKRVIGLPGDVITIKNGEVYVNGKVDAQNYTLDGYTSGNVDELVVPDGEVFVLGDNRLNSIDSREIGTQEIEDVKGVAFVRLWPPAAFGKLN
jgi:signal peptidase I